MIHAMRIPPLSCLFQTQGDAEVLKVLLIFTITIKEIVVYGNMKFTNLSNLLLLPVAHCSAQLAFPRPMLQKYSIPGEALF